VTVQRGTSHFEGLTVVPQGDVTGGSVAVDPAIAGMVAPAALATFDLIAGETYDAPLIFSVPLTTTVGSYTGNVSVLSATGAVLGSVAVTVQVTDPPPGVVPQDVVTPSGDRIGTNSAGNAVIIDELIVALEFGTADPEQRILAIAATHGAIVLGSVPEALTYQLWFPAVAGLAELEAIRQAIAAEANVDFATSSLLSSPLAAIPNDPKWDSWDEAQPGGNNWHLEMIQAPSAWDITTGDRSVAVAVIDADINTEHEDLAANVDKQVGRVIPEPGQAGHGTHVAGIACAVGNNGVGVTGVAWACSLRAYEFGFATLPNDVPFEWFAMDINVVGRMVAAARDGARVVNMSWGSDYGMCRNPDDPQARADLEASFDVLGRGILFAEHIGQDVLWVAAAGNKNCDASRMSPAGLASRFPRNVISVASVNHAGEKSNFSAFGATVSVAAPGGQTNRLGDPIEFVFSTYRKTCALWFLFCAPYGDDAGTSMAAPQVTGLAALVLSKHDFSAAQTKACIVAGAESDGIAVPGYSFHVINAPAAVKCEDTIALPPKVDLVFSLDLTGSMGQEIGQIQQQIDEIMAGLRTAAPDTDFRFGVVSYEDYAGTFNSSVCPDSDYYATYGAAPDAPFRVNVAATADESTVSAVVNSLDIGYGGDGPQSYGRAYWEMGQADTMARLGLRTDALKLVVDFGDDVPHDADLNKGIEPPLDPPFPSPFDTGYDPGRNGVIDCGGDDIDFQDDAIAALAAADVRLLHIDSSGDPDLEVYWNLWTSQTRGEFAAINTDGTVPQGLDLTQLIIQLLQLSV
jgi:subtilisin family serine protease